MIKASSLFYAIVISIIIAIVSSSFILFSFLSHFEFQTYLINQRLNSNADSGINFLLAEQSIVGLNEKHLIDLYNERTDSVELLLKPWGVHEIAISRAFFQKESRIRIAQTGHYPDTNKLYSIYLVDNDKPLSLSGKTVIKGTAYLPKAGIKRAYIDGQNFSGDQLIQGAIKTSEKKTPEFNNELIKKLTTTFSAKAIYDNDSIVTLKNEFSTDTVKNSFLKPTIVFNCETPLKITNGHFEGNIAFISDHKITISGSVVMQDLLIYAPKIIIEEGFVGNIQAFSTDTILLGKNVKLNYPSVLGIIVSSKSPAISSIVTNENDTINGCLFSWIGERNDQKLSSIIIRSKVVVTGQILSNGYADMQGILNGSLMCNKIILNTPSSVYENHLFNANIDLSKRSKYYVSTNILKESKIKKVAKWIY